MAADAVVELNNALAIPPVWFTYTLGGTDGTEGDAAFAQRLACGSDGLYARIDPQTAVQSQMVRTRPLLHSVYDCMLLSARPSICRLHLTSQLRHAILASGNCFNMLRAAEGKWSNPPLPHPPPTHE